MSTVLDAISTLAITSPILDICGTVDHGAICCSSCLLADGGLPDDEGSSPKITSYAQPWIEHVRPIIEPMFGPAGVTNASTGVAQASVIAAKRTAAGHKGGMVTAMALMSEKLTD